MRVAISGYHDGQTVQPVVYITGNQHSCHVDLYWFDYGDRTRSETTSFTGTRLEAERWLTKQGVHLDAQGIY
jgi:hypothetical protein